MSFSNSAKKNQSKALSNMEIEEEQIHNLQQQIYLMEQENKLLKEREKERTELMSLDLNDGDHMIRHLDNMKDKYVKMRSHNEEMLKALNSEVTELSKDKMSLASKQEKLRKEELKKSDEANNLAKELERKKEENRKELELLRKELDNQQRKAKQSTIEYTESRNELLEMQQALKKCEKDYNELNFEKDERTKALMKLLDRQDNELKKIKDEIATLETQIFQSNDQKSKQDICEQIKMDNEKLLCDELFYKKKNEHLMDRKMKLDLLKIEQDNQLGKLKSDIEEKTQDLYRRTEGYNKEFDKRVKNLNTRELNDAKEKKSIRTAKNNELEEQWNIRKIEMRKQRDKLINEQEEKKELQTQYNKLDEAQKDQAQEISNFKHRISELSMGIEEKQESISKMDEELIKFNAKDVSNDDMITKLETELKELQSDDRLDKEIEKFPLEKLRDFQDKYKVVHDNLENFNNIMENQKKSKKSADK